MLVVNIIRNTYYTKGRTYLEPGCRHLVWELVWGLFDLGRVEATDLVRSRILCATSGVIELLGFVGSLVLSLECYNTNLINLA